MTINEIAKLAQVSKSTVSKALNNYPGINEETRSRILKLVEELGYEPNSAAQALAFRRNWTIGLIIPHPAEKSLSGAFWSEMMTAVANESVRNGYALSLFLPQEEGNLEALFQTINRRKQVDGLVIGTELLAKKSLATLIFNDTPFVMLGKNPEFSHYAVDLDNYHAGCNAAEFLIAKGYKRIAFVLGPLEYYYNRDRVQGYRDTLAKAGLDFVSVATAPYDDRAAMSASVDEMLARGRPDAVICGAGGSFMFDYLELLAQRGLERAKTGFITFDDYRFLEFLDPPISAVTQPIKAMGTGAVQMLIQLLEGKKPQDQVIVYPSVVNDRSSAKVH